MNYLFSTLQQLKAESTSLLHERDVLKLRVKQHEENIQEAAKNDPDLLENKVKELGRKVLVYEVNESILSRKYVSLEEQLKNERSTRENLEVDIAEMETTLKKRILFLEQYKLAVGAKLGRLQGRLDLSVPIEDFQAIEKELSNLREDHLAALNREVEGKIATLKGHEKARELRTLKLSVDEIKIELAEAKASSSNLALQLEHQKDTTQRALASNNASSELSTIYSEMARFRGEMSRLELELIASNKRSELLQDRVVEVSTEIDENEKQVRVTLSNANFLEYFFRD